MSKFYTRRGDDGTTSVLGEGRVMKYDLRMEVLGSVDEATAALGMGRALAQTAEARSLLLQIQRDLYMLMAEAAATPENVERFHVVDAEKVTWLEEQTDALAAQVNLPKEFIVPGDTPAGAALDMARAMTRRAERRMAEWQARGGTQNPDLLRYLNRLSSLLFVLEIAENQAAGVGSSTLAKG